MFYNIVHQFSVMLQRIQSLFLLAVIVLEVLLVTLGSVKIYVKDPGGVASMDYYQYLLSLSTPLYNPMMIGHLLLAAAGAGLSAMTMMLYTKRPRQLVYCNLLLAVLGLHFALIIGNALWAAQQKSAVILWAQSWGLGLPLIMLILVWMAKNRIRKDEELVRSIDRIR